MHFKLKYGENPHQKASFRSVETNDPLAIGRFKRLDGSPFAGKEASWISITDLGRLLSVAERFAAAYRKNVGNPLPHFGAIVKHGSPCGAAFGVRSSEEVARNVWLGDQQAAFGGFFLCNFPFTKEIADAIKAANAGKMPFLSIAAPSLPAGIEAHVGAKASTRYFISNPALSKIPDEPAAYREMKSVRDLFLEQEPPRFIPDFGQMECRGKTVSGGGKAVFADLSLAYAVCSASASNTVTLVKNGMLIANAAGQQKRFGSAKLALQLAEENGHDTKGAVAASDSYFPFPDGIEILAAGGIKAIFATSGSVRDKDVFAAAERLDVSFFTVPDKEGRMFAGH